jgi:hypothetical protein
MQRIVLSSEISSYIPESQGVSGTLQALSASSSVSVSNFQGEFHILSFH